MATQHANIESWFLHKELVLKLLGPETSHELSMATPGEDELFRRLRIKGLLEDGLADYIEAAGVPSLNELQMTQQLAIGQLAWLDQAFHFRGVEDAYYTSRRGGAVRASFWTKLSTDQAVQVHADINAAWVTSDTGAHMLSGTRRQFVLAFVESVSPERVSIRPIVIGHRRYFDRRYRMSVPLEDAAHVWPHNVDQFSDVDFSRRVSKSALEELRHVPEEAVKHWFAEIIGEPDVPKDWGGEQYDLWTRHLTIQGERVRAAIAFKGPAAFHPMQIADLGKNGDQIQRLAHSPADLLVVQHCHSISSSVEHMLRLVAITPGHLRRYMLIDGYMTVSILRHFEYLPITA